MEASAPRRAPGCKQGNLSCRLKPDVLRLRGADQQHELGVTDPVVAEVVHLVGRIQDHVLRSETLLRNAPRPLPAHGDAPFQYQVGFLHWSRIAAYPDTLWEVDHVQAILAGRRTPLHRYRPVGPTLNPRLAVAWHSG